MYAENYYFAKRAFCFADMSINAIRHLHRAIAIILLLAAAFVVILWHCDVKSLGFALTVNHYYCHNVHIWNVKMFVPFRSFILMMMPHATAIAAVAALTQPTRPYICTLYNHFLENLYMWCDAMAMKWVHECLWNCQKALDARIHLHRCRRRHWHWHWHSRRLKRT